MIRAFMVFLMVFVLYEGFHFLPESMVVLPGVFRLSDSFFVAFPLILFCCLFSMRRILGYGREIGLIVAICALMLISPLMAQMFFEQPYLKGLVLIRQNLFWLSFFVYILLMRNIPDVDKAIRTLTVFTSFYVVVLVTTKFFPQLGLIHFTGKFYSAEGTMQRFGDYRLFFPWGSFVIYIYCLALARLVRSGVEVASIKTMVLVLFLMLIIYAVLATYTRMLVASLLVVTAFAMLTSGRRLFQYTAIVMSLLFICSIALENAVNSEEAGFVGESKLGRMLTKAGTLEKEEGRKFQLEMYMRQFMRSPLTGVGNIATGKDTYWENGTRNTYKKYGFFNGSDLGYPKILGESGLAGIIWVGCFFAYLYRAGRETIEKAAHLGTVPVAETIGRGHIYFLVYLAFSGITFPNTVTPGGISVIALAFAILAVTRASVRRMYLEKSDMMKQAVRI